jgi:SH3-like domain-containing protein
MRVLWKAAATLCLVLGAAQAQAEFVSIKGNQVNVRQGPSTKADLAWELTHGYPMKVTQKRGNWLKVKDFEGELGWVYKPLTQKTAHHIVKKPIANMRSGPGVQFKKLGTFHQHDVLRTQEIKNGWVKGEASNGQVGWISQKLLWGW